MPSVMPLISTDAALEQVGGKARSLAALAAAGLPVPAGFLVATSAYRTFVESNQLQARILAQVAWDLSQSAESASTNIQALFAAASIPAEIAASIKQGYATLGAEPAVAVRSSATAEDLPDLSFAGQHDSYLNVRGAAALLEAVRKCWASLWTARAISYRRQMHVDDRVVAMGVAVQVMVDADVSGVLFTANPASGERSELVVNASFGLGEAIVGGQVTPDTFVLDRAGLEPKETLIGAKETMVVAAGDQGTTTKVVADARRSELSVAADVVRELARLCLQAEAVFDGQPQDIEWAVADGRCWLLQSRPITNLPPQPLQDVSWEPPSKTAKLMRRQVVENMPAPLSVLFEELYLNDGLDQGMDRMMTDMGLPFDLDEFITRPLFVTVNGFGYCRYELHFSWRMLGHVPRILVWYVRSLPKLFKTLIARWRDEGLPAYLATIERWKAIDFAAAADEQLLGAVRALSLADARYWFQVALILGAAKISDGLLNSFLTSRAVKGELTSGRFLSGFPSMTLQAQIELEAIAERIRSVASLCNLVASRPADVLLEVLQGDPAGGPICEDIERYLDRYGHQVYNLDFAEPTQGEDPLPVFLSLRTLIDDASYDTPSRQAADAREREVLVRETMAGLGPIRRRLFRTFLRWAQIYGPHREQALFYMGAAWPTLRRAALELGSRLVEAGTLPTADAVFSLTSGELAEACVARAEQRARADLFEATQSRRELRVARMRLHPPARVPENLRFKFGAFDLTRFFELWETQKRNAADADTLSGFAVSPGKVTGTATVILSPAEFAQMKPGTILVCPTTTPAWTPLFTQASGLVTDIGGILAHGSIVAREYGIPAVLGTGNVTQRIVTGQRITVDGDAGTVTIID